MENVLKLLVLILLVALLYSFPAYAQEARCNELGADCICSETFDTTTFDVSVTLCTGNNCHFDPTNDGNTTKECDGEIGGGFAFTDTKPTDPQTVAATNMPPGATVTTVWRDVEDGVSHIRGNTDGFNTRQPDRMCIRHYRRWSPGYPGTDAPNNNPGECQRIKIAEIQQIGGTGDTELNVNGPLGSEKFVQRFVKLPVDETLTRTGDTGFDHLECITQWCRFEMCAYGSLGVVSGSMTVEGKATGATDGQELVFSPSTQHVGDTTITTDGIWLSNMFTSGTCNAGGNYQEISHAMQA